MSGRSVLRGAGVGFIGLLVVGGTASVAAAAPTTSHPAGLRMNVFGHNPTVWVSGQRFSPTDPDDITSLGGDVFVNYQNGVGPQGEPAADGTDFSTVIEYGRDGRIVASWDLVGKSDGLSADPMTGEVISTLNEDANSSLATIDPDGKSGHQVVSYSYSPANPLPHGGGTDALAIYHGRILISASAPGTVAGATSPAPAVYVATLTRTGPGVGTAALRALFDDSSPATVANTAAPTPSAFSPDPPSYGTLPALGSTVSLALTDPDSNEVVPHASPRFGGDFVLDSQGDQELIFDHPNGAHQELSVLYLSQSIDDSGYVGNAGGALYLTDAAANDVVRLRGDLQPGQVFVVATPSGANNAVNAPDYLATLNLWTGTVTSIPALSGLQPKGLIFVAADNSPHGHRGEL
jgi:hypothetical protein